MGKGVSVAPFARRDNPNNVVSNPNWQLMPHPYIATEICPARSYVKCFVLFLFFPTCHLFIKICYSYW